MFGWLKKKKEQSFIKIFNSLFSTHAEVHANRPRFEMPTWSSPVRIAPDGTAMDDDGSAPAIKASYTQLNSIPDAQLFWYASQSFIGYQMCAMLAQHWLVDKACTMPAKDAIRKGYEISINDGVKIDPKITNFIKLRDKHFNINKHMLDFLRFGRIFGIRVGLFVVDGIDYEQPFNLDGVKPNSYKGISQIDPYWIVPELSSANTNDPSAQNFYEPDFWRCGSKRFHKSHLVIFRTNEVADVLKPSYYYGGVSIPQKIFERVYAAERTANEAPMLAMTKRLTVLNTDLEQAIANAQQFEDRMQWWQQTRDNYGVKINGIDDKLEQFDLTLTDLDAVIMTQYQLVAMIAGVPGTKLLGTQPKGFNSTGEFEESSYHEELESYQYNDLMPMLSRHHELIIKSDVMPKFGGPEFSVHASWNELDAMTTQEIATVNATKAETGAALVAAGAIDAQDERTRLIADPDSGYSGLSPLVPPMPDLAPAPGQLGQSGGAAGSQGAAAKAAPHPPMIKPKPMPGA